MPDTTSRFAIRHPESGDAVTLATYFGNLADDADAVILGWDDGAIGDRPSAGTAGRIYEATDTGEVYYDDGAQWLQLVRAGSTLSSHIDANRQDIRKPVLEDYTETLSTVAASGSSRTLNLATANVFDVTLSANCIFTFSGARTAEVSTLTVIVRNDATGRAAIFPASVDWPDGSAPDLSAANSVHIVTFLSVDGGSTWFGMTAGLAFS